MLQSKAEIIHTPKPFLNIDSERPWDGHINFNGMCLLEFPKIKDGEASIVLSMPGRAPFPVTIRSTESLRLDFQYPIAWVDLEYLRNEGKKN